MGLGISDGCRMQGVRDGAVDGRECVLTIEKRAIIWLRSDILRSPLKQGYNYSQYPFP